MVHFPYTVCMNQKSLIHSSFYFLTLLILSSCTNIKHYRQELDGTVNVSITLKESKNKTEVYYLNCNTENTFNNGSTTIRYCKTKCGKNIRIKFKGTATPSKVTKTIAPAHASIRLGRLKNQEYNISFHHKSTTDEGKLIIGNNNHQLLLNSENVVK